MKIRQNRGAINACTRDCSANPAYAQCLVAFALYRACADGADQAKLCSVRREGLGDRALGAAIPDHPPHHALTRTPAVSPVGAKKGSKPARMRQSQSDLSENDPVSSAMRARRWPISIARFEFIALHDLSAASHAAERISEAVTLLQNYPYIGRVIRGELRELVIAHGRHGYVALYRVRSNGVIVLALHHQREVGFQ